MSQKKKVLIIDDEVDLCLLLKTYLNRRNYEVYCSHTLTLITTWLIRKLTITLQTR